MNGIMDRKFKIVVVCLASLFLIFLGVRNPVLGGASGPKPRPRAVIETTAKSSQVESGKQKVELEQCLKLLAPFSAPLFVPFIQSHFPCQVVSPVILASRAPPHSVLS